MEKLQSISGEDVPVQVLEGCQCFPGPLGVGCATCPARKKISTASAEGGLLVIDPARYEGLCVCGAKINTREGVAGVCSRCAEESCAG